MEYESYDSSGTDDDLPPSHRVPRGGGRVTGNGRPSNLLPPPYPKMYDDAEMEAQIHQIEKEAYISILRAFTAQADAITWEKESLITELRKELRLSNEEHRELLGRVNVDETIRRIRDWRKSGGMQPGMRNVSQVVHDTLPSPSVSASLKKHKPNQPMPSQSFVGSSPSFHPQADPMHQFAPSAAKRGGSVANVKGKKHKPGFPGSSSAKPVPFHPPDQNQRGQAINRIQPGPTSSSEPINGTGPESFVGRRVRTRWPEDNTFYDAVITTYNPADGLHALVYDIGTPSETWEWVNLSEISPEDIEWIGEDPGIANRYGYNGQNRPKGPNNVPQRGSVLPKNAIRKDFRTVQNGGTGKKKQPEIRIRQTNVVIREVERIFDSNNSNPQEIQWAKRILEEQENALVGAIAKLGEFSDGESEGRFHR